MKMAIDTWDKELPKFEFEIEFTKSCDTAYQRRVLLKLQGRRADVLDAWNLYTGVASDTMVDSGMKAVSGSRDDSKDRYRVPEEGAGLA